MVVYQPSFGRWRGYNNVTHARNKNNSNHLTTEGKINFTSLCIIQNLRGFLGIKLSRWNNSERDLKNFACYELYLHTHLFLSKDQIQKLNAKQDYAIEMDGWCCFTISGKTFIVSFPYSSWLLRGLCCTYLIFTNKLTVFFTQVPFYIILLA